MAIFLIATLGFTIYSHQCNTSGQTYTSLFEKALSEEDPCNHESKVDETCCSMSDDHESQKAEDKCCSNFEVFLRAEIILNIPSDDSEIVINDVTLFESDFELPSSVNNNIHQPVISQMALPPPITGAKLIILLNHQKISPEHII